MLQTITYDYDALNRLDLKTYPDLTTVDYLYDVGSRLATVTGTSPNISLTYTYDSLNRVKRVDT